MDCYACGWNERVWEAPPREAVALEGTWRVALATGCSLPGWLVVVPTRHVESLDELRESEVEVLGPLLRRLTAALRAVVGAEKTYVGLFAEAEGFAHVHFHVVPRMSWFRADEVGPRSLSAFLGKAEGESTTEPARDDLARRIGRWLDGSSG